jgi:RNA polymerase sigma-70 factor, ECF subfamily
LSAVNSTVSTPIGERHETAPATLGTVIGAGRSARAPAEAMWVALVRSVAAGEARALHELHERLHRLVFTLIIRIVRNRETAEELTLDVFHDVWRRASGYDEGGGTVIGWIMNQARSRAVDRVRFEHRKKRRAHLSDAEPLIAGSAEEAVDAGLRERVVRNALSSLTTEERQAIEIAYFSDRSYVEVAEALGEPPGTVKTRIRSGLIKLRRVLAEEVSRR